MKKTKILFLLTAILLLCLGLTACTKDNAKKDDVKYDMTLNLEGGVLSGKETVSFTNVYADGLNETVFHLYPNAYAENALHAAYAEPLDVYGGIAVRSVVATNGDPCDYVLSEDGEYLTVSHSPVKKNGNLSFTIEFETTIPSGNLRFSHNGEDYALSSFYPQLSVYDDGFRKDAFGRVGDPVFSGCASYDVTFTCAGNEVVACSLPCSDNVREGEKQTLRFSGENVRDFALALSPDYEVKSGNAGEVTIYYFHKADENAEEVINSAVRALSAYENAFGKYPFSTFSVARVPFEEEGMEFSGIVWLAEDSRDPVGTTIHETAHQWWYGGVGSDCINECYMDEGLTTFSAAYYYVLTGDAERYDKEIKAIRRAYACYERLQKKRKTDAQLSMDKSVYDYTDYQYTMVQYYKGCMMFANMYDLYGREKFEKALRTYYEDNCGKIGGKNAFIAAAKGPLGDITGLMNGWIGEQVVATTFAEAE